MKRIYIAGPISGRPKSEYLMDFWRMERLLEIDAMRHDEEVEIINPATTFIDWDGTYESLMEECFSIIKRVDMVVFLKGWEQSRGANMEYGCACAYNKDIYFEGNVYEK